MMGLIKDRHGTYYARHKVPERLQENVARLLDNGKPKQVWLKKSLGTKVLSEANVRAKPVQMEFDRLLAQAETQLKARPLRTSISDVEIKLIADYFYAHELEGDEGLREDGRGSDPLYVSVNKQLTDAGIEVPEQHDLKSLTLEPGHGLSPRMMGQIEDDATIVLTATQDELARGDTRRIRYEVNALLEVFQINLDRSCEGYRKLARAVLAAQVKALRAVLARHKGEPVETPPLIEPDQRSLVAATGTLKDALTGWQKERSPSPGVLAEYERATRLFSELHGELQVANIKRSHARLFREALQVMPRRRPGELLHMPLPELAEWGRKHAEAQKIATPTLNKLLGGVQTVAMWAHTSGMIPEDLPWSDPFSRMRLDEDASGRDAFTVEELNTLFAADVFTKGERPAPGKGDAAFWMPLLGLYSGARRSELSGLRVNDVQEIERVPCFSFVEDKKIGRRLKSATALRTVPIHPQLITLGWLRYVAAVRSRDGDGAWLFPQISPQVPASIKAWTKWFSRFLRETVVTDHTKVFHSFRHTFKDALRTASVPEDLNDALLGQKNNSVGRGYGAKQKSGAKDIVRRFGMSRLKTAVYDVTYEGLQLSQVNSGSPRKQKLR
jgi:integrase